jgi:formylmethanofuran dehydrogenase subunit A
MENVLIKNGVVFDPVNGIDGEVMDIAVSKGKIVERLDESKAKMIDATGKVVLAGGVDIHSHIAGPKVNMGRLLRPEDHYRNLKPRTAVKRAGVGTSCPSTFTTGYDYSEMGYTTVFEPANPALKMLHVVDEFNDTPMIDKGCYPLFGSNWHVMEYLKDGREDELAAYIAWTLRAVKGYAVKLVNPGGVENWKWGRENSLLDDSVDRFGVTPREIVRGMCKAVKMINLPHQLHIHANLLGTPGNYEVAVETLDSVRQIAGAGDGKPVAHLTHVQFNSYGGTNWMNMSSGAEHLAKYINNHSHASIDIGQVVFADTTTMTADGPFEFKLQNLTGARWVNADIEAETGCGIVPIHYKKSNYVHAIMWITGLEAALMIEDPWKVCMTTDHPNGGYFTTYPKVMTWLMSRKARKKLTDKVNRRARSRTALESLDREYSFSDILVSTRAGTARLLGLKNKGHLGVGADADIAIHDFDFRKTDPSVNYLKFRKAMRKAAYTLKDGEIVVKDGEVVKSVPGRTYWTDSKVSDDLARSVESNLRERFRDYYTIQMNNYIVAEKNIVNSTPVRVQAEV